MAKYYRPVQNTLECKDCNYYWKDEDDKFPRCHFQAMHGDPSWLDIPPCEEDWFEEVTAEEYYGYDEEEDGYNAENEIFSAQSEAELKYL